MRLNPMLSNWLFIDFGSVRNSRESRSHLIELIKVLSYMVSNKRIDKKKSPFRRSIAWYSYLVDILLLIWRHWVRIISFSKRRVCGKNLVVLIIGFQDKFIGAHLKFGGKFHFIIYLGHYGIISLDLRISI